MAKRPCPQTQCQSTDVKTLHAGYVKHRTNNEPACTDSRTGHNQYLRDQRLANRQKAANP